MPVAGLSSYLKQMPLIEICNVSKIYHAQEQPVLALQDITLEIEAGEFIALVGKSGCGKSTLLNLCGAVDFPTSGKVCIDGIVTTTLNDAAITRLRREMVGFVFQSFQLLQTMSVVENVELPLLLARSRKAREQALERLRWVDLIEHANRLPHQLSGGQQQRVAIARALVHNPKIVLADEPTGNLDSATGETVLTLLERIVRDLGTTMIMATHSAESAVLADRIVTLRDGRLAGIAVAQ